MLDKDIDKLFQERFEALEMVPTNLVWDKISENLKENKSKVRMNSMLWKVAASVLIFLSAAFWFYRPQEVIKLHGRSEESVARIESSEPFTTSKESAIQVQIAANPVRKSIIKKQNPVEFAHLKHAEVFLSSQKIESTVKNLTGIRKSSEDIIEPVQIETIYASTSPESITGIVVNTKLDFAESQLLESESPKIKIRSIGSLVNFVIAKVDHREDKIIEFKDSDEGSEVSGINLGVLKFKSRK